MVGQYVKLKTSPHIRTNNFNNIKNITAQQCLAQRINLRREQQRKQHLTLNE